MNTQLIWITCLCTLLPGCCRTGSETWEDTKTCGRYISKGVRTLFGQHDDSGNYPNHRSWSSESEFIPMSGRESNGDFVAAQMVDYAPPAKDSPGDPNSPVPSIEAFTSPQGKLAELFANIQFDTDQYVVVGEQNAKVIQQIAKHLITTPRTYVFIEGHADERGAAAYNLALGSRRANSVRAFLIQNGVNPDQLFTVSYGKERPVAMGHDPSTWKKNRRAQFRIYEK